MRTAFGVGLAALVLGLAAGCGGSEPKLDGTYLIVAIESEGKTTPSEEIEKASEKAKTIRIEGDKFIANKGGKDDVLMFKTDPSKQPKHIDFTDNKPSGRTEILYGIYRLEGDTLTVCLSFIIDVIRLVLFKCV
jgi:uncharacterized protein (TIGR03067 family)